MADRNPTLSAPNRFLPGGEANTARMGSLRMQSSQAPPQADNFRTRPLQRDLDDAVGDCREMRNTSA